MLKAKERKIDITREVIDMSHGSGGAATQTLIDQIFSKAFNNPLLDEHHDSVAIPLPPGRVVVTTDSHVITPLFFQGGNIGDLAFNGTVNDIAMSGAIPYYLTASFILQEGFPIKLLKEIVDTMGRLSKQYNIPIVAGDTKVVERQHGDGVYITTTGIGVVSPELFIGPGRAKVGDKIILTGTIGDHGVAVMSSRHHLSFATKIQSDTASLHELVSLIIQHENAIHCLRDPTRGGVATSLNEIAKHSRVGMLIHEDKIPISEEVEAAAELLGLDPLYIANEGKMLVIASPQFATEILDTLKAHPLAKDAAIIGEVISESNHFVQLQTVFGSKRIIGTLQGEQLPRIC